MVAVCPIPYEADLEYHDAMMNTVNENGLYVCDIRGLKRIEPEIGLSVNYHRIIRGDILSCCAKGFYNIHHSYNLRLRGRNITTHAILNTVRENIFYHGTSLYLMSSKLDAGSIVAARSISIEASDTAYTLFNKADEAAFELVKEWLPRLAGQKVFLYEPPAEGIHFYRASDLPDRQIDIRMRAEEINAYVRAFDFPGKEPCYMVWNGSKVHLVYKEREPYSHKVEIKGCCFYSDKAME